MTWLSLKMGKLADKMMGETSDSVGLHQRLWDVLVIINNKRIACLKMEYTRPLNIIFF
jgi:hypothetical protein